MINKYGLGVLVVSVAVMTSANEQIDQAIDDLSCETPLTDGICGIISVDDYQTHYHSRSGDVSRTDCARREEGGCVAG